MPLTPDALLGTVGDPTRVDPTGTTQQPVTINDGGNQAAVKSASTPPVATDKALVVVLSPNQPPIPITPQVPANTATGVIFGRVQYGISSGVLTAIRATVYTEQTVNFTGSVQSSNANDSSAGTGARTVKITYFNSTGAGPFTETVTLNGTTAVNLVSTNHCFIERIEVITVGSLGHNAGTISLFTGAGATGTTVGSIGFGTIVSTLGDDTTLWAHHYLSASRTISIHVLNGSTLGTHIGTVHIRSLTPLIANSPERVISDFLTLADNARPSSRPIVNPIKVSGAFTRFTIYIVSQGTSTHFFGSFDFSEEDT